MKRITLDWLEFSYRPFVRDTLKDFGQLLYNKLVDLFSYRGQFKRGESSRFYQESVVVNEAGITVQSIVKPGLKNFPFNFRFTGKFWTSPDQIANERAIEELFAFCQLFGEIRITRADCAIDYINAYGEALEPFPEPKSIKKTNSPLKCIMNEESGQIETFFSGKSDCVLRVYDKLAEDPDYLEKIVPFMPVIDVWRVEFEVTGETCKSLFSENEHDLSVNRICQIICALFGQKWSIPGLIMYSNKPVVQRIRNKKIEYSIDWTQKKAENILNRLRELELIQAAWLEIENKQGGSLK